MNISDLQPRTVWPPSAPVANAAMFVDFHFGHPARRLLVNHGATFRAWDGTYWPELEAMSLRAAVYEFLGDAAWVNSEGQVLPFNPTIHKVNDIMDALAAAVHLPAAVVVPSWLDAAGPAPAADFVSCANGLLHIPTRQLSPHTPSYFAHYALPFAFDDTAPTPERWLRFLGEIWPHDPQAIDTLQEAIGYAMTGDTSLQKIFLIVGPKRSGKGTIARVLTAMLGAHNVAGPTLAGIGTNFGLSPLVGKPLAIISDARLRDTDSIITERLLSISGEDRITIDRKYREPWTGRLPTRFLILTNELPRLNDSSGALASRFVILTMSTSFYGRENPRLTEELCEELPGILRWALDGLERLRSRGYFLSPQSSADALRELEDLGSPVGAFVRDECVIGMGHAVDVGRLYQVWRQWCGEHGRDRPGTAQTFGRDLRAAVPGLRTTQLRTGDGRQRRYEGIGLAGDTPQERAFHLVPLVEDEPVERGGTRLGSMSSSPEPAWLATTACIDCGTPIRGGHVRCSSCADSGFASRLSAEAPRTAP